MEEHDWSHVSYSPETFKDVEGSERPYVPIPEPPQGPRPGVFGDDDSVGNVGWPELAPRLDHVTWHYRIVKWTMDRLWFVT